MSNPRQASENAFSYAAGVSGKSIFEYDAANRMDKVRLVKGGEAASVTYLHNALGQRVFKSEVTADQKLPRAKTLGAGFVAWLKANFQWMYAQALADASIGTAYTYARNVSMKLLHLAS